MLIVSTLSIMLVDECLATDGFVAYRSNTGNYALNSPKIRYWNNTANSGNGSFGSEVELATSGSSIRYLVLKQSPVNSKIVLVTQGDDGYLDGYVCMKSCENASNWNLTSNIGYVGAATQRMFDFGFGSSSGKLLLVYGVSNTGVANDLAYKILSWSNTTFTGLTEQYLDDTGHATDLQYMWISMDSKPLRTSEEMLVAGFDFNNSNVNAWVWNGTGFGAIYEISTTATATSGYEALAVKYSTNGTVGMVAAADGTVGLVRSAYWSSNTWTVPATFDPIPSGQGQNNDELWLSMDADPSTDDLQLVFVDSGAILHTAYWDGSAWTLSASIDSGIDSSTSRSVDFAWLPSGNTGKLVWDTDIAGTNLSQMNCSPRCNGTLQTFSTYANTGAWLTLYANPTLTDIVKFIGIRLTATAAFDIGAFWYNGSGLNYTNYGDTSLTADVTSSAYESYSLDYRRDTRQPNVTFITPNATGITWSNRTLIFNINSNEYLLSAILELNGTNYTMNGSDLSWNYTFTGLVETTYTYKVYALDLANNTNVTAVRNITIDFHIPRITLVNPQNNSLSNNSRNITFYYNVTDTIDDIYRCGLIIDGSYVLNTTVIPVSKTSTQNFTYAPGVGQHNWSIWCNDSSGSNSNSSTRNITSYVSPILYYTYLDDAIMPYGEIMLSAGSTRFVNCSIIVSDPDGPGFVNNATAKLYYFLNRSVDPDNANVHYTSSNCTLVNTTAYNKTFSCGFDVLYYANNGTWICNISVNNAPFSASFNISTIIQPLYAVNVSDGIAFDNVRSGLVSGNIAVNVTNFGNMPVNVTLQGYALTIGDNTGMNCSDGTNITITNIRFSTDSSASFDQKTSMTGLIQPLNLQIAKQFNSTEIFNQTYWQITPDPGKANRICSGHIIFTAEAP